MADYCELHDWQTIAHVTTSNGMFAIVPPYFADTLGKFWNQRLGEIEARRRRGELPPVLEFEEVELHQRTHSVTNPDGFADRQWGLMFQCQNGGYDVDARFCDECGDGHLSICELRIRLHDHEGDEDEAA